MQDGMIPEDGEDLSPEDVQYLEQFMDQFPKPEEKPGIFSFLNKVIRSMKSSKVSNVNDEELFSVRSLLSASEYSELMGLGDVATFIDKEAEITLSTSLSKQGFLINAASVARKDIRLGSGSGEKKKKTGWFKKNVEGGGESE